MGELQEVALRPPAVGWCIALSCKPSYGVNRSVRVVFVLWFHFAAFNQKKCYRGDDEWDLIAAFA